MNQYNWADPPSRTAFPIARPGYPFIFAAAFVTVIFALIEFEVLAIAGVFITLFICYFFRDPDRVTPDRENAVISPADGRIVFARVVDTNPYGDGPCLKVGIFMSIFNVHVNRVPFSGVVKDIRYYPGRFYSADKEIASTQNEHNAIVLTTSNNHTIGTVQIAGLIARRIICWTQEEETVTAGQRFGMICFGSRVDLYLPADTRLEATMGDKVSGGATILGYLP